MFWKATTSLSTPVADLIVTQDPFDPLLFKLKYTGSSSATTDITFTVTDEIDPDGYGQNPKTATWKLEIVTLAPLSLNLPETKFDGNLETNLLSKKNKK